jgi:hypothetical protein
VYHKTLNPPPESDKKLMERLKPIEVNFEKVESEVQQTQARCELIFKRFRSEFGIEDQFGKTYLLNEIDGKIDKQEVLTTCKEILIKYIDHATCSFRQKLDDITLSET